MLVENDWLKTNIRDRLKDKEAKFRAYIKPYKFKASASFDDAADATIKKIASLYPKLYVPFSGGMDSSFVFRCLTRNKVNFTPFVVRVKFNRQNRKEITNALLLCQQYSITPEVIEITETQYIDEFFQKYHKPYGCHGIFSYPLVMIGEIAKKDGAKVLSAGELVDPYESGGGELVLYDYEYYNDLLDDDLMIPYETYSLDLVYHTAQFAKDFDFRTHRGKWLFKKLMYRTAKEKIPNRFNMIAHANIAKTIINRYPIENTYYELGTFEGLRKFLELWKE